MVTPGPLTSVPPAAQRLLVLPQISSRRERPCGRGGSSGGALGSVPRKFPGARGARPAPAPGPRLPSVSPAFLSCFFMMWFSTFRLRVIVLVGPLHSGSVVSEPCRPLGAMGSSALWSPVSPHRLGGECSVTLGVWKHLPLFLRMTKGHVLRVTHTQCVRVRVRPEVPCPFSWALWGGGGGGGESPGRRWEEEAVQMQEVTAVSRPPSPRPGWEGALPPHMVAGLLEPSLGPTWMARPGPRRGRGCPAGLREPRCQWETNGFTPGDGLRMKVNLQDGEVG